MNKNDITECANYNLEHDNIEFLFYLVKDSYFSSLTDNTFCVFKSINEIIYLIYSNKDKSIISYNLINNQKINEIKNAHDEYIINFRYYLDTINKRDLILSISKYDNNIKLWNIYNYECLLNLMRVNIIGEIYSAYFINDNNQNYIITSNYQSNFIDDINRVEPIKVYDFNGNIIKEINDSDESTLYIYSYYENKNLNNYILTGNKGYIKSYDYNKNKVYHKYGNNDFYSHNSIVINNNASLIEIIESSFNGYIRIWNFHSGELLNIIKVSHGSVNTICLWNNNYLFAGTIDYKIILIDLKNVKIIKEYEQNKESVLTIRKINHPKYGECLISSQSWKNGKIKLWAYKK